MPPVAFAISTAVASIGTALGITAVGMPLAGTHFLANLAGAQMLASFAVKAFIQIATGVALSALARALAPKPKGMVAGVRSSVQFGESAPSNIILGRYATAGDLAYAGSHGKNDGTPNAYYTMVLELADHPATLSRVLVNGAWCSLSATAHEHYGTAVTDYREDGKDYLWVKFYDGTQTAADPGLVAHYGDDGARPYRSDMIGRGISYAIVTALHNPKIHRGVPEVLFELDGMRLYDPRKDTGVGRQRPAAPERPIELDRRRGARELQPGGPGVQHPARPARPDHRRAALGRRRCAGRPAARRLVRGDERMRRRRRRRRRHPAPVRLGGGNPARGRAGARRHPRGDRQGRAGAVRRGGGQVDDAPRSAGRGGVRVQRRRRDHHQRRGARSVPVARRGV
jgi:hypothetical protein